MGLPTNSGMVDEHFRTISLGSMTVRSLGFRSPSRLKSALLRPGMNTGSTGARVNRDQSPDVGRPRAVDHAPLSQVEMRNLTRGEGDQRPAVPNPSRRLTVGGGIGRDRSPAAEYVQGNDAARRAGGFAAKGNCPEF